MSLVIAIDGPAGSGKSTIAKMLAAKLDFIYIDTGAMYRAIALLALQKKILDDSSLQTLSQQQIQELTQLAESTVIEFKGTPMNTEVFANGENITLAIRTPQVTQSASVISSILSVREVLVAQQKEMGKKYNVVMDGRDIGTNVFPNANVKIFIDASAEVRSRRRFEENILRGETITWEQTHAEMLERDKRDRTRSENPLRKAEDAVHIDTSDLNSEQVLDTALKIIARVFTLS